MELMLINSSDMLSKTQISSCESLKVCRVSEGAALARGMSRSVGNFHGLHHHLPSKRTDQEEADEELQYTGEPRRYHRMTPIQEERSRFFMYHVQKCSATHRSRHYSSYPFNVSADHARLHCACSYSERYQCAEETESASSCVDESRYIERTVSSPTRPSFQPRRLARSDHASDGLLRF